MRYNLLRLSALLLAGLILGSCCDSQKTAQPAAAGSASADFKVTKTFHVGGAGGWDYLTYDAPTDRLYVTRGDRVIVLSAADGSLIGTIADTAGVHGVALVPELDRGFASDGKAGQITVFDLKTLATLGTIKAGNNPDCIIYDPASKRILAFNGKSKDMTAADAAGGFDQDATALPRLPLGGKPEFAVADGQGQVFVNIEDTSELLRIDSRELKVTARWPLAPGEEPTGLAMDMKTRRLFVTCGNQQMVVLDADSGKVVATPAIGQGVDAAAFDPGLGLAISSNGQGTLTLIHEDGPDAYSVAQTVPTAKGARTMALDRQSHRVFLATAEFEPTPTDETGQPKGRPKMKPDTFMILVVER